MSAAHTPGPWFVNSEGDFVRDGHQHAVACVYGKMGSAKHDDCSLANARLIAAAPQLVEALTLMMRAYATEDGAHLAHEAVRKAALALAGATP